MGKSRNSFGIQGLYELRAWLAGLLSQQNSSRLPFGQKTNQAWVFVSLLALLEVMSLRSGKGIS